MSVVAGVSRAVARSAAAAGAVDPAAVTWLDALVVRVFFVVSSLRLLGDGARRSAEAGAMRGAQAVAVLRQRLDSEPLPGAAQLVVSRHGVRLFDSLHHVHGYLVGDLAGEEMAQVLPVGRWWGEISWRSHPM